MRVVAGGGGGWWGEGADGRAEGPGGGEDGGEGEGVGEEFGGGAHLGDELVAGFGDGGVDLFRDRGLVGGDGDGAGGEVDVDGVDTGDAAEFGADGIGAVVAGHAGDGVGGLGHEMGSPWGARGW